MVIGFLLLSETGVYIRWEKVNENLGIFNSIFLCIKNQEKRDINMM